jgi:hypothetical protein
MRNAPGPIDFTRLRYASAQAQGGFAAFIAGFITTSIAAGMAPGGFGTIAPCCLNST